MARRKVIKTRVADMRNSQGYLIDAVWCDLECGHYVIRRYSNRQTYIQCNCHWCEKEKQDKVKYVPRYTLGIYDGPDFVPDYNNTIREEE